MQFVDCFSDCVNAVLIVELTKLQRRESQLVTELGKLLVELTTVKSQLQVTNEKLTTETEKSVFSPMNQ